MLPIQYDEPHAKQDKIPFFDQNIYKPAQDEPKHQYVGDTQKVAWLESALMQVNCLETSTPMLHQITALYPHQSKFQKPTCVFQAVLISLGHFLKFNSISRLPFLYQVAIFSVTVFIETFFF